MKRIYDKYRNLRSKCKLLIYHLIYQGKLQTGTKVYVRKGFTVLIEGDGRVKIGEKCFFNNFCSINALKYIEIGNDSIFGENVHIYDHNHIYKDENIPVNSQGFTYGEVRIGNNCWIGSNVTILKGVTIGNHSVIGAGCVVYKDVPENTVIVCEQNIKHIH